MGITVEVALIDLRMYRDVVLPAYATFVRTHEVKRLVELLHLGAASNPDGVGNSSEGRVATDANPYRSPLTAEVESEYVGILQGELPYRAVGPGESSGDSDGKDIPVFVRELVMPALVESLCVPAGLGVVPVHEMSERRWMEHLYAHSSWIEEVFTFERGVTGGSLEVTFGESAQFLSSDELREFETQLRHVRAATRSPEFQRRIDDLLGAVQYATTHERFAMAIVIF